MEKKKMTLDELQLMEQNGSVEAPILIWKNSFHELKLKNR
jgi:hypothetical protein